MSSPRDRLIVALDVPTAEQARELVAKLRGHVGVYKIGLELLFAGGFELARELAGEGEAVFIDAKLLDIETTVERATNAIARTGARFVTVHGLDRKTLTAARRGCGNSGIKLLAVTVLTNLDAADLAEQGIDRAPADLVLHRAMLAKEAGFDGIVASGQEAATVRKATGHTFLIVTPGIRPKGSETGDQTRSTTPEQAIAAGADYLVVGRPITRAADPGATAEAIIAEIAAASA